MGTDNMEQQLATTGYTLWYRPQKRRGQRRSWTPVVTCPTSAECTDAMHAHPDTRGQYLTLPVGKNPNHTRARDGYAVG